MLGVVLLENGLQTVGEAVGGTDSSAREPTSQAEFRPRERRDRTQEGAGSSPASSMKTPQMRGFLFGRGLGERLVFLQALRASIRRPPLYEEGPCVNLSFEKGRASTSGSCLAQPWRVSSRWVVGSGAHLSIASSKGDKADWGSLRWRISLRTVRRPGGRWRLWERSVRRG